MRLPRVLLPLLLVLALRASAAAPEPAPTPLRVIIAGLVHGHVAGFLRQATPELITVVGVVESREDVWARYAREPRLAHVPHFTTLAAALAQTPAEAVWAFSDTHDHLAVVRDAVGAHRPVIVEKPLADSWAAAAEIAALAARNRTLVLTNYETSWYPAFADVLTLAGPGRALGPLRQVYVQAGHEGPAKIHVQPEFLDWLRDPQRAGAGALFDFGCYGANLLTWWLGNRAPEAVWAETSTFDPADYPQCDDHAVMQLVYPDLQATVVGSWRWPYSRKDAALYGDNGALVTADERTYTLRLGRQPAEAKQAAAARRVPLAWLAAAVRAGRDPVDDPSSLANNLIVMRILEAARISAAEHRRVSLAEIGTGGR